MAAENVLSVRKLSTEFHGDRGHVRVLEDVSFEVGRGKIVGLVGKSGSGKTVTALSLMGLVPVPPGKVSAERIDLDGTDLAKLDADGLRRIRGRDIAMVFQEPMTSLNPVRRVWEQVGEPLRVHRGMGWREIRGRVLEMFELVGIPEPRARLDAFPHQLSGGLRQRAMIAMGLICEPKLLIADEPTTALDVTTQAQIMRLMVELRDRVGTSIIMITHDLGIIAEMCDFGERHVCRADRRAGRCLRSVRPSPASLYPRPPRLDPEGDESARRGGCPASPASCPIWRNCRAAAGFRLRCDYAMPICAQKEPGGCNSGGHRVRCWLHEPHEAMGRGAAS